MARIREFRRRKAKALLARSSMVSRERINLQAYNDALSTKENLKEFQNYLPASSDLEGRVAANSQYDSDLRDQTRLVTAAFESGLTSAADLFISAYDTHTTHDALHEPLLAHTTDAV